MQRREELQCRSRPRRHQGREGRGGVLQAANELRQRLDAVAGQIGCGALEAAAILRQSGGDVVRAHHGLLE